MTDKHDDGGPVYPMPAKRDSWQSSQCGMSLRDFYAGLNVPDQMVKDILDLDDKHLAKLVGADPEDMAFILRAKTQDPVYQTNVVLRLQWVAKAIAMTRGIIADAMIAEKRSREAGE